MTRTGDADTEKERRPAARAQAAMTGTIMVNLIGTASMQRSAKSKELYRYAVVVVE
jgi:hypothetical protein